MKNILIVNANYYKEISKKLVISAQKKLIYKRYKVSIINIPGIYEIPIAIRKNINKFNGFVALGCVIKGETPHFEIISKATINAIMDLSVKFKKPIGNGIITCVNKKQALERADPTKRNKGGEAARAVLSVLGILKNESQ